MIEFLSEYGLFLAKSITVVVAILLVVGGVAASTRRGHGDHEGEIKIENLNEAYEDMEHSLKYAVLSKEELKKEEKAHKKKLKEEKKSAKKSDAPEHKKRIFVLDFDGDVHAEGVENLGTEITTILTVATEKDEVVLRLESPGGQVHAYGLAASQLARITAKNIPFTVCVDKVAASGGYMMACIADKVIAAPFAILGSIGVIAELPNFNRILKKNDVDYEVYTAGKYKRTVSIMGEITKDGEKKFKEELESTHVLFKDMVSTNRPDMDIEKIATGEHWYGTQAIELQLADEIRTSEDYLFAASKDCDIYSVSYEVKRSVAEKLGLAAEKTFSRTLMKGWSELTSRHNRIV